MRGTTSPRWTQILATAVCAAGLVVSAGGSQIASADTTDKQVTGALDPATFEGNLAIATPDGDVYVNVSKGELPGKAAAIRQEVKAGADVEPLSEISPMACGGVWQNAVAGPNNTWWTSTTGCAVFGYPGYVRPYEFQETGGTNVCVQGKGFDGAGNAGWWGVGCGADGSGNVPWGNTLANTQVRGQFVTVASANYRWRE